MERANLDWANLGFGLVPTDFNVRYTWKDGVWSSPEVTRSTDLVIPMAATALHYGQALFEGMKALETVDGRVVVFRPTENGTRMARGARKLLMEPPPLELFVEGVTEAVRLNRRYVPPCESGAVLYIRPLLIGTGPRVGVGPADEYTFLVFVTPVGPYFTRGMRPIRVWLEEDVDRAAPNGVGDVKAAGNYAAGMRATAHAHEQGFDVVLHTDPRENKYIDECSAAIFFGIQSTGPDVKYITPQSTSILASVTNDSIMTVARDLGLTVEHRPVEITELATFQEAGCCGTATIVTPIGMVQWRERAFTFHEQGKVAGPWCRKLYDELVGIQTARIPDRHGWLHEVPR